METLSYYNEMVIKLNYLKADFDKVISTIKDSGLFVTDFINPAELVQNAVYKIKEQGRKNNFEVFGEDSYIKYTYVLYFEEVIGEMTKCLHNCVSYMHANVFSKMAHKGLLDESIEAFNDYNILLRTFQPEFIFEYLRMLIETGGYFEFFKPGMFYKYVVFLLNDIEEMGMDFEKGESYGFVMSFIRKIEDELEKNKQNVDYDTYDEKIEEVSKKYHVDFVSLDKDFSCEVWGMDNEKDGGNSRTRK